MQRFVCSTFLVLAAAVLAPLPLRAQYFGQNKVQYRSFHFKIIQTEHFEVYYYDEEREAALDAARMAERGYAKLSRVLNHRFQGRKPIILYASHSDFQQTNAISGDLGEGTGGVTEFFKHRMVLPFTGSYADFEHVLLHEMAHQFQYDVYSRGRIGSGVQTLINVNPPLWFFEGMAEFLSVGPIDPNTAMWLRDAALEGKLPTVEQMTLDPYTYFPYRFGHALWSYVAEKWGDEIVGEILQASATSGIEGAFYRATGLTLDALSEEWKEAIQLAFLPQIASFERTRRIATPTLTQRRTGGTLHLAPALSPDGREIAFYSERNDFFVNLWVADVESGRIKRQLVKQGGFSTNYESLRFIYSTGAYSPDGRWFALAAKRKEKDDLVILDARTGREFKRIRLPLNGLMNPTWSPDGRRLAFTGFDGGMSDLYVVNSDGSDLRRLTDDKYADLHPAWSPDGATIAFATDRGPETNFNTLEFGELKIAMYRMDNGTVTVLDNMPGRNINPVWSPDGKALAFISDRTGISNVFLYERADGKVYQLSNVITGISGITAMSPALSWAARTDRLAVVYYSNGLYDVYVADNPRSLKKAPYTQAPAPRTFALVQRSDTTPARPGLVAAVPAPPPANVPAPKIVFSETPAVLLQFDGEPRTAPLDTSNFELVVNTAFAVIRDKTTGTYYLNGGNVWYSASNPKGPWTAGAAPPEALRRRTESEAAAGPPPANPPAVIAATEPTELVVTQGAPSWQTTAGGKVSYVENTETPWIREADGRDNYLLISGRWFRSASLTGPWRFAPADQLPASFQDIPADSPIARVRNAIALGGAPVVTAEATPVDSAALPAASVYRSRGGFRASAAPQAAESSAVKPVSVRELLDSAEMALPDTLEFGFKPYRTRFSPDYVARPTVGYSYDNFGRGLYGGAAVSMSDMLGNKMLIFAGAVNGRPQEAQLLAVYVNQGSRLNWAIGAEQAPTYFYGPYAPPTRMDLPGNNPDSGYIETVSIQRNIIRSAYMETAYPLSRFSRFEFGLRGVNIDQALVAQDNFYDLGGFYLGSSQPRTINFDGINYVQPSLSFVHDRTLFGYVGPFAGTRFRMQAAPTFGDWRFVSGLADYRRYFFARPFTLALRGMFFGRMGPDADQFPAFLGNTELIRGYTYGSITNNECLSQSPNVGGCTSLDELTGSKLLVGNAELRFPLFSWLRLGFLPVGLPPVEGAVFYDAGMAWNEGQTLKWDRDSTESSLYVRAPLRSWGGSIRVNALGFMILRFDYTKPLDRRNDKSYWTVSFGPTF